MFKLLIADDEGKTTVVPLVRDEITIGRKEGNTIRLTERNISRKHAKLKRSNGAFMIEDLSSYNGVKVNGRKIQSEIILNAGDQIAIGDYQLALQLEGGDTAPTLTETTGVSPVPAQADIPTAMIQAPQPAVGPPARLVMLSPPAPGAEYAIARERMKIGRAEDLDIWVNHRSISREHAEVFVENGVVKIRDLESANGLRVNGQDIKNQELRPGDMVELGQVRFRYVPAGEAFTFDEGRTMQMDAVTLPQERTPNRAPIYIGAGVVAVALLAAGYIAFSTDATPHVTSLPGTTPVTPVTPVGVGTGLVVAPTVDPAVPVAPTTPDPAAVDASISRLVAACRSALNAADFVTALTRAQEALTVRPGDPAATQCNADALSAQLESDVYSRGLASVQSGNLEAAYQAFDQLPPDSPYRHQSEVQDAIRDYRAQLLTQAEQLASADPDQANQLAASVLSMPDLDAATRRRATDIAHRTRHASSSGTHHTVSHPVPTPVETHEVPHETPHETPTVASTGGGQSVDERVRQCALAGDQRQAASCVIGLLGGGRAHGASQLNALFRAYRAIGDTAQACGVLPQLIPLSPASQQANLRQFQTAQCH